MRKLDRHRAANRRSATQAGTPHQHAARRGRTEPRPKSTCQTSVATWWKPTHVGGHAGTMSRLCVKRTLICAARSLVSPCAQGAGTMR